MSSITEKLAAAVLFAALGLIIYCIAFVVSKILGSMNPESLAELVVICYSAVTLVLIVFENRRRL